MSKFTYTQVLHSLLAKSFFFLLFLVCFWTTLVDVALVNLVGNPQMHAQGSLVASNDVAPPL